MTLAKDFNAITLVTKYQNDAQYFMYRFNLYAQGNKQSQDRVMDTNATVKVNPHGHKTYP